MSIKIFHLLQFQNYSRRIFDKFNLVAYFQLIFMSRISNVCTWFVYFYYFFHSIRWYESFERMKQDGVDARATWPVLFSISVCEANYAKRWGKVLGQSKAT